MKNLIIILAICSISCIIDYDYKAISIEPNDYDYKTISIKPNDYSSLARASYYLGIQPSFHSDTRKHIKTAKKIPLETIVATKVINDFILPPNKQTTQVTEPLSLFNNQSLDSQFQKEFPNYLLYFLFILFAIYQGVIHL